MLEPPLFTGRGDHQDLGQILGPAVAQRRHQIGDSSGEALHGAGGDPPPGGRAVGHLELLDTQVGVLESFTDVIEIEQEPIGRRQRDGPALQGLPLAVLDLPPATDFTD